ncbi:MAG TPA: FdtA/QdtA family cupin domain-containing protein [Cytophagaceae bacterium]|jgi:dTDP-4-dehydrorhamnose 3,5-epimerase-like enzyme|nr:FdtA/QdtA family cupin domain-containing protein [Cytophagaceae bacterium]
MGKEFKPHLIDFKSIGSPEIGYLTAVEGSKNIPFDVKRVFWSYYTPQMVTRGRHAHYKLEQILVPVAGKLIVTNENVEGETTVQILENPNVGLYIPPMYWHVIQFSHNAVMMSLASMPYDEKDYIRDYEEFKKTNSI